MLSTVCIFLLRITDVLFEKDLDRTKNNLPFYISKKGKTKLRSLNQRERLLFLDSLGTNNFKEIFHEHANNNKLITINWIF